MARVSVNSEKNSEDIKENFLENEGDLKNNLILYDVESEQELIGYLILNNRNIDLIIDVITPKHFYYENHQIIFAKTIELIENNHQADEKVLFYELESKNLFSTKEELKEYLELLVNSTAGSLSNVKSLVKIINELYLKRCLNEIRNNINSYILSKDVNFAITKAEEDIYRIRNSNAKSETKNLKEINKGVLEKFKKARDGSKDILGLKTNLKDLDVHLGGLQKSDLIIVAARPSMGKTALAITLAKNIARNALKGKDEEHLSEEEKAQLGGIAFFSLEMSSEQISSRIIAMESGFSTKSIHTARKDDEKTGEKNTKLSDGEFQKIVQTIIDLDDLPLYIDDTPSISISYFKTRCRYLKRKYNISAVFVDYLQLMTTTKNTMNRVQEISEITQGLKAVAKELEIPVIALSQLSRAVEMVGRNDKKPKLSDLRESGSIEQDADIVTFLYRESYYLEREISINHKVEGSERQMPEDDNENKRQKQLREKLDKCRNVATVIIAKNRNGPVGEVNLYFNSHNMEFNNLAEDFNNSNKSFSAKPFKRPSAQIEKEPGGGKTSDEEWYKNIKVSLE